MRNLLLSTAAFSLMSFSAFAADHYEFDKSHTRILFFINHMGMSETVGDFTQYDGTFTFDEKAPATSTMDVTIKPAGVHTPSDLLDKHLQSKDFFNSEQFPEIHFVSTGIKMTGEKTGDVTGNLTMLGVTKPVVMKVTFNKADYRPVTNDYVAGFKGEATLKRSDFGMSYGIPMVGDEVRMEVRTELVNLDRKKAEAIKKN